MNTLRCSVLILTIWFVCAAPAFGVVPLREKDDSESGGRTSLGSGTGIMVNAGYFFKDTMFYSRARGGPHVNAGRIWALPHGFGVWTGVGAYRVSGTQETLAGDRFETTYESGVVYADIGIVTPYFPIPISAVFYRHSTDVRNLGLTGVRTGSVLTGSSSGLGVGLNIQIMFEWFFWGDNGSAGDDARAGEDTRAKRRGRTRGRGLGLVVGYIGFMDARGRDLVTRNAAGDTVTLRRWWKPLKGESLRLGLEYEF